MQFKYIPAIVLLAASLVSADVPGSIYLCSQTNWTGTCENIVAELGFCQKSVNMLNGAPLGSFGPNNQTICIGFNNDACNGNPTWGFAFPGDDTAGVASGAPWNNTLASFQCYSTDAFN